MVVPFTYDGSKKVAQLIRNPRVVQDREIILPSHKLYDIAQLKSMRDDKCLFYSTKNQCPATFSPSVYVWCCT